MDPVRYAVRWLLIVALVAVGCNQKPTPKVAENRGEDADLIALTSKPKSKLIPVKRDVKDLAGNWVVVVTVQQSDLYRWIIKFVRGEDGQFRAEIIDSSRDREDQDKPEIIETLVKDDVVKFVMKNQHGQFDFEGLFQDGFVRGTIKSGPIDLILTRLLPTESSAFEETSPTGFPPGADVIQAKMKDKDLKPEDILAVAREYRTSPIAQDIFSMVLNGYGQQKTDQKEYQELINDYLSAAHLWGPRWEARVEMNIAVALVNTRVHSRMALSHFDAAEKLMGDNVGVIKDAITAYREAAQVNLRVLDISNPDSSEEVKASADTELSELVKKQPFNGEILWALANYDLKHAKTEKAIEYLSDICSLPLLEVSILRMRSGQPPDTPTPHEELIKLWKEKGGTEETLREHLLKNYDQRIGMVFKEIQERKIDQTAQDGSRTVLVEFFTSIQSPQCVAAEIAVSGFVNVVPPKDAVVIRYHQHIPLPDGLTNQDSEERGAFYEIASTPTVIVDGVKMDPRFYSGPVQGAAQAYEMLRRMVEKRREDKSDVKLELSATLENGLISVSAEAKGIAEDLLPSCRLRLAIVENNVEVFLPLASNGVRNHEYVVRELLGGSNGIAPKKGELKYSTTIPVDDFQKHITEYLNRFEAGRRQNFLPEMKPPVQGPLSLVAWIQNGAIDKELQSKLVLQSAIIPIGGQAGTPTAKEPEKKEEKAESTPEPANSPLVATPSEGKEAGTTPPAPALPE